MNRTLRQRTADFMGRAVYYGGPFPNVEGACIGGPYGWWCTVASCDRASWAGAGTDGDYEGHAESLDQAHASARAHASGHRLPVNVVRYEPPSAEQVAANRRWLEERR